MPILKRFLMKGRTEMDKNEKLPQAPRKTLAEKINKTLDIPPDVLPHGTLVSIRGRVSLSLSGRSSILLYTPEEIKLAIHKNILSVKGCRLVCSSYHAEEVRIDGRIDSVSFEEE